MLLLLSFVSVIGVVGDSKACIGSLHMGLGPKLAWWDMNDLITALSQWGPWGLETGWVESDGKVAYFAILALIASQSDPIRAT